MTTTPLFLDSPIIKSLIQRFFSLGKWLMELFDPPPLKSMSFRQKVGRVVLLSTTLVVGSILVAMLGALGLYLVERGRELGDVPEFYNGVAIILLGIAVNLACIFVLVQIKRADMKLMVSKS